jgi:hypothetical protein
MNELKVKCESVIKNEAGTTTILRNKEAGVRVSIVNAPFVCEPGRTYTLSLAEVQEG